MDVSDKSKGFLKKYFILSWKVTDLYPFIRCSIVVQQELGGVVSTDVGILNLDPNLISSLINMGSFFFMLSLLLLL